MPLRCAETVVVVVVCGVWLMCVCVGGGGGTSPSWMSPRECRIRDYRNLTMASI